MIWRDVVGREGMYEVSDTGLIRSVKGNYRHGILLKLQVNDAGYLIYSARQPKPPKLVRVHRAVAEAFIGPSDGMEVNHKDCNKQNNNLSNLEYVTHKENGEHASRSGVIRRGELCTFSKVTESQAREIKNASRSLTHAQVALQVGVSRDAVIDIRKGKSWNWIK